MTGLCHCGAPSRGLVCQRGHRVMQEDWAKFDSSRHLGMTRSHFAHIADIIHRAPADHREGLTDAFAGRLGVTNSGFKRSRFETAAMTGKGAKLGAKFTKGHFEDIAAILRESGHGSQAAHFADSLGSTNPLFNRGRFMTAASGGGLRESKDTARLSVTHAPIGKGGTNWVTQSKPGNTGELPAYIQNIRNAIMRGGKSESEATAIAIGRCEDWASGKGDVSREVRAAAAKAVAEFKAMQAKSHVKSAAK